MRRPVASPHRQSLARWLPAFWLICICCLAAVFAGCGQHSLGSERVTPPARIANTVRTLPASAPTPVAIVVQPSATASLVSAAIPARPAAQVAAALVTPVAPVSDEAPPASPEPEAPAAVTPAVLTPIHAVPVRVMIPRIGVNARVIPVGTALDGAMDSPNNPFDVGWWDPGARPGDYGSAVLGGHVDYTGYGAAVFWNLKALRPGDQIRVVEADNTQLVFSVNEVETYSYSDAGVIDRIFRTADRQGLNVITCTGTFDARTRNYDQRVVVYAALAGS